MIADGAKWLAPRIDQAVALVLRRSDVLMPGLFAYPGEDGRTHVEIKLASATPDSQLQREMLRMVAHDLIDIIAGGLIGWVREPRIGALIVPRARETHAECKVSIALLELSGEWKMVA